MRNKRFIFVAIFVAVITAFIFAIFSANQISAQSVSSISTSRQAEVNAHKAKLEADLAQIDTEIVVQDKLVQDKQQEVVSYQRDVALLGAQVNKAKLVIKAKDIVIRKLGDDISEKKETINELTEKIDRERQSLAQLVRKTDEVDQSSIVEVVLSQKNLSDFFLDLDSFTSIKGALKNSLGIISEAKEQTEEEKISLEDKQRKEADTRAELDSAKRQVQKNEAEKAKLLSITKNQKKEYQKVLDERKKQAAQIRAALFALRDTGAIPFGRALEYAQVALQKTGVRPAFLLAVFTQESGLGANVGSCYLKDKTTGAGVGIRTGKIFSRVMKPTRDVEPFLTIVSELGGDPFTTRISCPQEIGWGGAMGPAQFIPSTWMGLRNSVAKLLGKSQTDPWNPEDAFMAAAVYLRDLGAANGGYSAERDAACRYFSGSRCSKSSFVAGYGNSVIAKATHIQENMIDPLNL